MNLTQMTIISTTVGRNPLEEMGQQKSHGQLACEMSAIVWYFEHSLALSFFGIGMKTDLVHIS